jgi:hypothetical protein
MLIYNCVLCIFLSFFTVECRIFSLNNKYSNKQTLQSITFENGMIKLAQNRFRRKAPQTPSSSTPLPTLSVTTTTGATVAHTATSTAGTTTTKGSLNTQTTTHGSKENPMIVVDATVLNDTQKSNHAYIHWIGKGKSERIIILTCTQNVSEGSRQVVASQIWRSDNYGTSFNKVTLEGAKISYFYFFPGNEKKLLFTDVSANKVYVTEDELDTHTGLSVPVEPNILLPHPSDENKILLYSLSQRKLYVSINFAVNWTLLLDNVLPNFYWGVEGIDQNTDIVHIEVETGMPSQAVYKTCIIPDCTNAKADEVGPFMTDSLIVHKEYIFVQKSGPFDVDAENYLMVSYNRTKFQRAYFPGDLKADDFMFLNLDDGQAFVAVNHGDYVNLYLSDVTGQYYVLSLTNIYHILRLGYFEIDFHEMKGMNWTFLVNRRDTTGVKTYVSFDKGGNWSPLNQSCQVAGQCFSLLEVKQSAILSSMLSQENAPGIILAHGIMHDNLDHPETAVFTSNNGGLNWTKAHTADGTYLVGRYRFNILDQGSIITAVPDGLLTGLHNDTVFYSCDEGKSWSQQQFDAKGLIIKGVLTEPGSLTMVESVFGHQRLEMPWMVIKLNFANILSVKCKESDYREWRPTDNNNVKISDQNCILGQKIVYTRRDPDTKCYNGEIAIPRKVDNVTCECTAEDYECDFGYEETKDGCNQTAWFDSSYSPHECDLGGNYGKSSGYRKIPADVCVESKEFEKKYGKVITNCTSAAPSKLSIVLEAGKLAAGKEIVFHLEQAGGSKFDSTYTWDFGDGSKPEREATFNNASIKKHIFRVAGHYTVNVTAENTQGKSNASALVHVQDSLVDVYLMAQVVGKTGMPLTFNVIPISSTRVVNTNSDHVHFVWNFGDENPGSLPLLTWNGTVTHVFNKAGKFKMSVEAVNSVSSVYKEQSIQMFDDVEILTLTFSSNVNKYMGSPFILELFSLRIKQQLAEDVGVNLARLYAVIVSTDPTKAYLYILQSSVPGEQTVAKIVEVITSQVKLGVLGVNLFGKLYDAGEVINITSATKLSTPSDRPSGPNMKAVYIAAPILVLVVAVSIVSFMYCRKKLQNLRQYNILHSHDDSDALLDDDEAPLNLNVDFGTRESSRDDPILDAGGSHLVMVTGGGSSDNAENC